MSDVIRGKYLENLAKVKQRVLSVRRGGWQEREETMIVSTAMIDTLYDKKVGARCEYDLCYHRDGKNPADIIVCCYDSDERGQEGNAKMYGFHRECLERLLVDKRIEGTN